MHAIVLKDECTKSGVPGGRVGVESQSNNEHTIWTDLKEIMPYQKSQGTGRGEREVIVPMQQFLEESVA